jgi:Zn-dependent alcohol dehydrogenase
VIAASKELRLLVMSTECQIFCHICQTGLYVRPLPFVCGSEGAGHVVAVGAKVTKLKVSKIHKTNYTSIIQPC